VINQPLQVDDFLRVMKDKEFSLHNIYCAGDISMSSLKEEKVSWGLFYVNRQH
jgi:hypothetical protein